MSALQDLLGMFETYQLRAEVKRREQAKKLGFKSQVTGLRRVYTVNFPGRIGGTASAVIVAANEKEAITLLHEQLRRLRFSSTNQPGTLNLEQLDITAAGVTILDDGSE